MSVTYGGTLGPAIAEDPDLSERFSDRARALFYARLAFLGIGLMSLAVPAWSAYLGTDRDTTLAFVTYFFVIGYSVLNFLLIDHPKFGRPLTFVTLTLDVLVLGLLALVSGGLESPVMSAQLLLVLFYALLFRKPIAILAPLLVLPAIARIDLLGDGRLTGTQLLFLVIWHATLAVIVAYVLLYLGARDEKRTEQVQELSKGQEEAIVAEERLRLAREIHDGLGGSLSTLIIQSEFIQRAVKDDKPELVEAITELKAQAEEAIDELRRSLTMMRRDFDLHKALEDYCMRFQGRSRSWCTLKVHGRSRRLPSDMQLTVFRLLQECLTNIQKHAECDRTDVWLKYDGDLIYLTVRDDGVGFDSTAKLPSGHYGLENMQARASKYRGSVKVESKPGEGTSVSVTLVIPAEGSHVAYIPQA